MPTHLHLLGVLHHQRGNNAKAIELIGRAVALWLYVPAFTPTSPRPIGRSASRSGGRLLSGGPGALAGLSRGPVQPGAALQGLGKKERGGPRRSAAAPELRPDFAVFHNNLGIALRDLGQADEALSSTSCRRRRAGAQTSPSRGGTSGRCCWTAARPRKPLPHCQEAVRLRAGHGGPCTTTWAMPCAAWKNSSKPGRRIWKPCGSSPTWPPAHAHLGLTLHREGQAGDAPPGVKCRSISTRTTPPFGRSSRSCTASGRIRARPSRAGGAAWRLGGGASHRLHLSLGWALQEEGRLERARRALSERPMKSQPDSAPAQLNLGGLARGTGPFWPTPKPRSARALRVAAQLRHPPRPAGHPAARQAPRRRPGRARTAPGRPRVRPGPRASLLFGLAHVLDARGDYARAAECLREANALSPGCWPTTTASTVPAEHQKFVDRLLSVFDARVLPPASPGWPRSRGRCLSSACRVRAPR